MVKAIFLLSFLVSSLAWAEMPVLKYQGVGCRLLKDDEVVSEKSLKLMTLTIDTHIGRFQEIQFGDEQTKIQYQILIEDDVDSVGHVLVLQNLKVGELESSSEFSTKDLKWVRLAQGSHSVKCELQVAE